MSVKKCGEDTVMQIGSQEGGGSRDTGVESTWELRHVAGERDWGNREKKTGREKWNP